MTTVRTVRVEPGGQLVATEVADGGHPPVVFVCGMNTTRSQWDAVTPLLATRPATIMYDRPGLGDSPPRPRPNPPLPYSVFATELAAMLDQIGLTEPAVLVGHSFGSLIIRVFAARHPDAVAGMVHVDGSVSREPPWTDTDLRTDGRPPDATAVDAAAGRVEMVGLRLRKTPTVVVVQTPGRWNAGLPTPIPGADEFWQQAQAELARDSEAPLIVAADAGHEIPREAPTLVALAHVTAKPGLWYTPDRPRPGAVRGRLQRRGDRLPVAGTASLAEPSASPVDLASDTLRTRPAVDRRL